MHVGFGFSAPSASGSWVGLDAQRSIWLPTTKISGCAYHCHAPHIRWTGVRLASSPLLCWPWNKVCMLYKHADIWASRWIRPPWGMTGTPNGWTRHNLGGSTQLGDSLGYTLPSLHKGLPGIGSPNVSRRCFIAPRSRGRKGTRSTAKKGSASTPFAGFALH